LLAIHFYLYRAITTRENDVSIPQPTNETEPFTLTPLRDIDLELYTIRINTWKRHEQLVVSIEHHSKCVGVAQIQVVWCEDAEPPPPLLENPKVVVERHTINSLNERFHILEESPTLGILSMDDDVLRPCEAIDSGFFKWTRNPHRMVGFDARTHVELNDGTWKYGYMSTTEKSNKYSLSLPRYCFLHKDYLNSYMANLPRTIFIRVQQDFNCEDIAMSFWISHLTGGSPPLLADVWAMKSLSKLYSPETISGTKSHKALRDACVNDFADILEIKGKLKKAKIWHSQQPWFHAGDEGNDEPPKQWRLVERNAELEKTLHHWKHLSNKKLMAELNKLKTSMIRHAFVLGLIADSPPWKRRWKLQDKD
jgi:glucuronyl/N-acetylglucosaminyl transferase EXT2